MTELREGPGRVTRILIVDDNPDLASMLSDLLAAHGYATSQAGTGQQALDLVYELNPDLVILDIMLPDMNGMEVCARIKQDPSLCDVFVVVFSGAAGGPELTIKGLRMGADDYLTKSLDPDEFLARIGTMVRLRHTTAALRHREQHYRGLVQILPDGIVTTDLGGRILSANSQALAMLACTAETDLLGKSLFDIVLPDQRDHAVQEFARTLQTGAIQHAEFTFVRAGGHQFPGGFSAAVTRLETGEPSGLVAIIRDHTERKRFEDLLTERAEFNRRILSTAMDGFWLLDREGRVLDVNEAYCAMSGYTRAELLTMRVADFECDESPAEVAAHLATVVKAGHDGFETRHRRKNGEVFAVEVSTTYLPMGDGFVFVFIREITQRKRAEAQLSEALNLNKSIMAAASVGILAFRSSGACIFNNSAARRMFGVRANQKLDFTLAPAWVRTGLTALAEQTLKTGNVHTTEVAYPHSSGKTCWLHCHMARFATADEAHLLVIVNDRTKRRFAEEELKRLPGRILQAQETERLRVSRELHDGVNQLLASAKMRLHNVLADGANTFRPSHREVLRRCEKLLVQALEENRSIAHNLRPRDLDELGFETACRNFCRDFALRTNLGLQCQIPDLVKRLPEPVELTLFRIMQEALNNIEKHASAKKVQVVMSKEDGAVTLSVSDDGCGIKPRTYGDSAHPRGPGLGLLGMKERAGLLGGQLSVAARPEGGTVVSVTLRCERT